MVVNHEVQVTTVAGAGSSVQIGTGNNNATNVAALQAAVAQLQAHDLANQPREEPVINTTSHPVTHNLGRYPEVEFIDNTGVELDVGVDHVSQNQFILSFNVPTSGTVIYR